MELRKEYKLDIQDSELKTIWIIYKFFNKISKQDIWYPVFYSVFPKSEMSYPFDIISAWLPSLTYFHYI